MSKITDFYNGLEARINTLLPNYKPLSDPIDLVQNSEHLIKLGYGIVIGPALNTNRASGCFISDEITIGIILTRKFYASEMDITRKSNVWLQLKEDQKILRNDFQASPQLNLTDVVSKFIPTDDSGILKVFSEDKPFVYLISNYKLEYFESLT